MPLPRGYPSIAVDLGNSRRGGVTFVCGEDKPGAFGCDDPLGRIVRPPHIVAARIEERDGRVEASVSRPPQGLASVEPSDAASRAFFSVASMY
ncbi:hypothetical protein D3C86_1000360 [compost metagenome]